MAAHRTGGIGRRRAGQATLEFALLYAAVIVPMTFGIVFVAEMYWVWHSMVEFTRDGARYAATHCYQDENGSNVQAYMRATVPFTIDQNQFQVGGTAAINVQYFQLDPSNPGNLIQVSCTPECSLDCVPDAVTVSVTNYQFQRFTAYLKLPPVTMPSFFASLPIESNGCDPENVGSCSQ